MKKFKCATAIYIGPCTASHFIFPFWIFIRIIENCLNFPFSFFYKCNEKGKCTLFHFGFLWDNRIMATYIHKCCFYFVKDKEKRKIEKWICIFFFISVKKVKMTGDTRTYMDHVNKVLTCNVFLVPQYNIDKTWTKAFGWNSDRPPNNRPKCQCSL